MGRNIGALQTGDFDIGALEAAAAAAQTISPSGIASAEAFGTATLTGGLQRIEPTGITSAEAFGNPTLTGGLQQISPSSISSAEAFGTAKLSLSISGAGGIASGEALGTAKLSLSISGAGGIASAEAFGSPKLNLKLSPIGIPEPGVEFTTLRGGAGPFVIDASNDQFSISVGTGAAQVFTLTHGTRTAAQIVADLAAMTGATAYVGSLYIRSDLPGVTLTLNPTANSSYATLGFAAGTYSSAIPGPVVTGGADWLTLFIAGVRRNGMLQPNSLRITSQVRGRGSHTASFRLYAPIGSTAYRPPIGAPVIVQQGTSKRFAGLVYETNETPRPTATGSVEIEVTCCDYNKILDRRIYAEEFPANTFAWNIMYEMVRDVLAEEGISLSFGSQTLLEDKQIFNYETCTAVCNRIADLCGVSWWVDYDKRLTLAAPSFRAAPFSLTNSSHNWINLRVRASMADGPYRNVQYVRSNIGVKPYRSDTFTGDGANNWFITKRPLYEEPWITVDGVTQTVGISGEDTGKDYYYIPGGYGVQTSNVPAVGAVLIVSYPTELHNVARVEDATKIAERKVYEGGSGKWEHVQEARDIQSEAAALNLATELLGRYSGEPKVLECEVLAEEWLEPGDLLPVSIPQSALSGDWVVESVTSEEKDKTRWRHQIRATQAASPSSSSTYTVGADWKTPWSDLADKTKQPAPLDSADATFLLAERIHGLTPARPLEVGEDVCNPLPVTRPGILYKVVFIADEPPTGSDAIIDILCNGVSIFAEGDADKIRFPAGSTTQHSKVVFASDPYTFVKGDVLRVNVDQVGSTFGGQNLTVVVCWYPTSV